MTETGEGDESASPDSLTEVQARVRALVQSLRAGESGTGSTEIESLPDPVQLQARDHQQDIDLKKRYANWLLGAVVAQLFVADAVFVIYAWAGKGWDLDAVVINVWLGATLIQAIGVVAIVTRYLFPRRDIGNGSD